MNKVRRQKAKGRSKKAEGKRKKNKLTLGFQKLYISTLSLLKSNSWLLTTETKETIGTPETKDIIVKLIAINHAKIPMQYLRICL